MWKSKTITAVSLLLCVLPSCTAMETLATSRDEGRINITADREGMKAFSDMIAAQAQIAKDSPDLKGPSWQLRELEKQQETMQYQIQFGGQE